MSHDTASTLHERSHHSAFKLRLLTLDSLDHRYKSARRARDQINAIERELELAGHKPSTSQRQIIQRVVIIGAMIEDIEAKWLAGHDVDPLTHATLSNSQRRLLGALGLRRETPPPPTADDLQAETYAKLGKPEAA